MLLVFLAVFDTTYLATALYKSVTTRFGLQLSSWHHSKASHAFYGMGNSSLTASIFMTVSIAWER